jgi:methionyl-tRNA formyltransferase
VRIGYFGDGPWAHQALERLVAANRCEVLFIVPRFDTQDPILEQWAHKLGVPFLLLDDINNAQARAKFKSFSADLFVSMSFNQIIGAQLLDIPPLGFINCHAGALPFYRGRNPLNWVLINGEREFGITCHYIDEGIDTGDIVLQRHYPIQVSDDYGTLLNRAIRECAAVINDAVEMIVDGSAKRTSQSSIHPVGTYFSRRLPGDEWIDWDWSSEECVNFIRGIAPPGPGARVRIGGQIVALTKARLIPDAPSYKATTGEVVGRHAEGVVVKTGSSTILTSERRSVEADGALANPTIPRWSIGTRFKQDNVR